MTTRTALSPAALAAALGLALAAPAVAQYDATDADLNEDERIDAEEARDWDATRFEQAPDGVGAMDDEDFAEALPDSDDPETAFGEADADASGDVSLEEWMDWRADRFEKSAGETGSMTLEDYLKHDRGGLLEGEAS